MGNGSTGRNKKIQLSEKSLAQTVRFVIPSVWPDPSFPPSCSPNPSADCIDRVCCHVREPKKGGWGYCPDVQQ